MSVLPSRPRATFTAVARVGFVALFKQRLLLQKLYSKDHPTDHSHTNGNTGITRKSICLAHSKLDEREH